MTMDSWLDGKLHICLTSTRCLDNFPHNSSVQFVNNFSSPLKNPTHAKFYIRLRAIVLSNQFESKEGGGGRRLSYVKVHLEEVEPQPKGRGTTHCITGFKYPISRRDYDLHVFHNSPVLPLRFNYLDKLAIRLTDIDDQDLKITHDYPTCVWVEMMTTSPEEEQFTLTCSSKGNHLFPHNTLSTFNTPMLQESNLSQYKVALQQIIFPPSLRSEGGVASLYLGNFDFHFNLSEIDTTEEFIDHVCQTLRDHEQVQEEVTLKKKEEGENMRLCLFRKRSHEERPVKVVLNEVFAYLCGASELKKIRLSMMPGDELDFPYAPALYKVRPKPVSLLTCDILQPSELAPTRNQILHYVPLPVQGHPEVQEIYEPPTLTYHNIVNKPTTHISFEFLEVDGAKKIFKSEMETDGIELTLHFKRK